MSQARSTQILETIDYDIYLSTDVKPTTGVANKSVILEVDTSTWWIFYDGTWYPQA